MLTNKITVPGSVGSMIIGYDQGRPGEGAALVATVTPKDGGIHIINLRRGDAAREHITYLSRPRLRFNWGYWDGAALTARGVARQDGINAENILGSHFDPFYAHGFTFGAAVVKGKGMDGRSSERAWQDFLADLTDPNLMFQIEANP